MLSLKVSTWTSKIDLKTVMILNHTNDVGSYQCVWKRIHSEQFSLESTSGEAPEKNAEQCSDL